MITGIIDPSMVLGFAQSVLAAGRGSDDQATDDIHKISYGALLFHDDVALDLKRLDICHVPSVLDPTIQTGVLHGVAVAGSVSCSVTLRAPVGQAVKLKVLQNGLQLNSILIYNSSRVSPDTLYAEVSINHTGTSFRFPAGVVTIVENTHESSGAEEWSMFWAYADGCADTSDQCPQVIEQIAQFGYDCDTTLDEVSVDDIPWPPKDATTGKEIPLPRNPATGQPVEF